MKTRMKRDRDESGSDQTTLSIRHFLISVINQDGLMVCYQNPISLVCFVFQGKKSMSTRWKVEKGLGLSSRQSSEGVQIKSFRMTKKTLIREIGACVVWISRILMSLMRENGRPEDSACYDLSFTFHNWLAPEIYGRLGGFTCTHSKSDKDSEISQRFERFEIKMRWSVFGSEGRPSVHGIRERSVKLGF